MNQSNRPIAIDLFCGAGGLSLGFEQAGFTIAAAFDHDPINVRTHHSNFPSCRTLKRDITHLSGDDICKAAHLSRDKIDVVIGGPPCQGFSLMGRRRKEDPRNLLLYDFARIVDELQPRYWVMENVQGLMMGTTYSMLSCFLKKVKGAGYAVVEPIKALNASDYGVPQARKRIFVLGYKPSLTAPSYREYIGSPKITNKILKPTVWDAISDLYTLEDHDELLREDAYIGMLGIGSQYSRILRGKIKDPFDLSLRRHFEGAVLTGCRRSNHTRTTIRRFSKTKPGGYEPISRFYRLTKTGVSNVLRAGTPRTHGGFTAPRPIHPVAPRCITVREAARLHSFPDWFAFDPTVWHGFRQIGNSVPPLLARGVGTIIRRATEQASFVERPRMGVEN